MQLANSVLFFNAGVFALFALPHIFAEDGNMLAMGWDMAKFMPSKGRTPLPVPVEFSLMVAHLCGILGSCQLSLVIMCLLAGLSSSIDAKRLALRTMVVYQALVISMQFYKPSGTGVEGSPAMGPLPVIVALGLPSVVGAYMV